MTPIQRKRLEKLERHLRSGKLFHERFVLMTWNAGPGAGNGCGTEGCAIGECPGLFPEDWYWQEGMRDATPMLRKATGAFGVYGVFGAVFDFFGAPPELFRSGSRLPHRATRFQVADAIRDYLKETT